MGMFDNITCKYPLHAEGANALDYQTKDLECRLDRYEIRENGTLWHEVYEVEDHSPATKWEREHPGEPPPPEAQGLAGICGLMTRVNRRWEFEAAFTGEVRFYTFKDEANDTGWIEWSAYFQNGKLANLNLMENRDQ